MPYLQERDKKRLSGYDPDIPKTPGELNYCITKVLKKYLDFAHDKVSYQTLNDILGALEGAKLEFVRRVVIPYECLKIRTNGDVY